MPRPPPDEVRPVLGLLDQVLSLRRLPGVVAVWFSLWRTVGAEVLGVGSRRTVGAEVFGVGSRRTVGAEVLGVGSRRTVGAGVVVVRVSRPQVKPLLRPESVRGVGVVGLGAVSVRRDVGAGEPHENPRRSVGCDVTCGAGVGGV
jgi:hypothetical protein